MRRVRVSVLVPLDLDRKIEHLAVDLQLRKYELYELGARLVTEILVRGGMSEETRRRIDELRKRLAEVCNRAEAAPTA